jgi:hypothetical protein
VKITKATANPRKRAVEVTAGRRAYEVPYSRLPVEPTRDDPIEELFVDRELGREAFTYRLRSGAEESMHLDAVREIVQEPEYLRDLFLHKLSVEVQKGLATTPLGKREIARHLGTSPAQLYRLLDPEPGHKSLGQLLALLDLLGREVDVVVRPKAKRKVARAGRAPGK